MQMPEGIFCHFGKQSADSGSGCSNEFAGQHLRVME